ncbi:MAG: DNA translocase FtsK, partial [Lachnospiraceae bacterium]
LIAGATGSGKSVCINTLIMSLLYKASPDEVKLIMIDPKVVELSVYNGIPHLLIPVVTDPKKAAGALHWGVAEMTDRYQKFADFNVRDLKGYNALIEQRLAKGEQDVPSKMPQIVIIVDELADLMMVAPGEVEESICRLAQLARAAGIHLIIATQRPSVDVITGLIKANMPSRVAFAVSSGVDSRTILDMNGAEKLLGKGDMLFYPQGYPKPARMQGAFVSDREVGDVVDFLKNQTLGNVYNEDIEDKIKNMGGSASLAAASGGGESQRDAYFEEAGKFIIEKDKASIGMLQRVFKIGFNRAARIMDQLADAGVVGDEEGTKPRKVLMSMEQFEAYIEEVL